jgi:hypothetical protein
MLTLTVLLAVSAGCSKNNTTPTSPGGDTTAPTVSSTNPIDGATGVAVITATFSEPMTASTITAATFSVLGPAATAVPGTVTYNPAANMATFTPNSALADGTSFSAKISVGAKDVAGNAMASSKVWTFTTVAASSAQSAPALGSSSTFVVLAGSTITSTGATALIGDMGVSPGTAVTGFPPASLSGVTHAGDASSAAAMADLNVAYNDAAGRSLAPVTVAGNLGGLTLPPGLYRSNSSLAISSGDLTLDAQGDVNAVFIFQMASTLTTTSGRAVILAGGARPSNIFWQVGSSATLGTTSDFKGTIMADQSITLNTGVTLNGRALARVGAVTLDGNAAVVPTQ